MGDKLSKALDKPQVQHLTAWIGFFGFFIGESDGQYDFFFFRLV